MSSVRSLLSLALPAVGVLADVPGVIRNPLKAITLPAIGPAINITRRQDAVGLQNHDSGTLYTIDLAIGTAPQPVTVIIDTGSNELWVNPICSKVGNAKNQAMCEAAPVYNPAASTSYVDQNKLGHVTFGKGFVDFDYASDHVTVGGAQIKNQIFGVATDSGEIPLGIMGLSPPLDASEATYPFVLDSLAQQGFINSRTFSLDLRGVDSPDGSVIFGGIDTGKYSGSLEKLPIVTSPALWDRYWINMNFAGMTMDDGTTQSFFTGTPFPVFLDSGGTLSRLPTPIYQAIATAFPGATLHAPTGLYIVDCAVKNLDATVDFGFGGKVIRVSYKDFVWQPDPTLCVVGVLPEDDEPVLGDSFLRAAFVVYDQDNRNMHLAQAANCGTNLVAIGNGVDAVPSVTGDCPGASSTASSTSSSTSSATSTSTESSTESTSSATTETLSTSTETTSATTTEDTATSSTVTSTSDGPTSTTSDPLTTTETTSQSTSEPGSTSTQTTSQTDSVTSESTSTATTSETVSSVTTTSETSSGTTYSGESTTSTSVPSSTTETIPSETSTTTGTSISDPTSVEGSSTSTTSGSVYVPEHTSTTSDSDQTTLTYYPTSGSTDGSGGYPTTTSVIIPKYPVSSATYDPYTTVTSTYETTHVYTVTSCPPDVVYCTVGAVTTEIAIAVTTYCPGSLTKAAATDAPKVTYTSTYIATTVYPVAECAVGVSDCYVGKLTTQTYPVTTTWCPEEADSVPTTLIHDGNYPWGCTNCGGGAGSGSGLDYGKGSDSGSHPGGHGPGSGSGSDSGSGSQPGYTPGSGSQPSHGSGSDSGSKTTYCGAGSGLCTATKEGAASGTGYVTGSKPTGKTVTAGAATTGVVGLSMVVALNALFALVL